MTLPNVPYQLYVAGNGYKVVSTGGSAVQLSTTDTPCSWVYVQAISTNTGIICIGTSTCLATTGANRSGIIVEAAKTELFPIKNLDSIWMDGVSTEGCSYVYYAVSVP